MTKHTNTIALHDCSSRPVCPLQAPSDFESPLFKRVNTLDVGMAVDAWETLSVNTRAIEYQEMPATMHRNFLRALLISRKMSNLFV